MDRSGYPTRRRRLSDPDDEPEIAAMTVAERMALVWPMTLQAWGLTEGLQVTVLEVGGAVDGHRWSRVSVGPMTGWVADEYLMGIRSGVVNGPATSLTSQVPNPPPTEGTIVGAAIPSTGFGLIVYGGGSSAQLVAAAGCDRSRLAFWVASGGKFVQFVPAAMVGAVNAEWDTKFAERIPPSTVLVARCGDGGTQPPAAPVSQGGVPAPSLGSSEEPVVSPSLSEAASKPVDHVVVEGDTLSAIAARYRPSDVGLGEYIGLLQQLNELNPASVLSIGRVLQLSAR